MKLLLKVLIPVLVLVGSVFAARIIIDNRPEPRQRPSFPTVQAVEAITLTRSDYPVRIGTQGTIQPSRASTLVSEVNGSVTGLSPNFVVGGSFKAGDLLVQIDERDYAIALTQAKANLAQTLAVLQEEAARSKLAKAEWESLGRGKASAITLRLPQLAAARASRDAAQAQVERAQLDLDRTRIVAPFAGRVLEKDVDEGQFVGRGARLGRIHSLDSVDVRLPVSNRQLTYLDIPQGGALDERERPRVELNASIGGKTHSWIGELVRAEGVDQSTQQLNVIAQISNPFETGDTEPLRIGQYVNAQVDGRVLENVFVVPRAAVREDREVLLVNADSQIERREITVAWADERQAAISEGLEDGAVLVTTPMSTVANGTPVRATIDGVAPPPRKGQRGQRGAGGGRPGKDGQRGGTGAGARGEGKKGNWSGDGQRQGGNGQRPEGQRGERKRPEGQRPEGARGEGKVGDPS